jgi:hypothetical protein
MTNSATLEKAPEQSVEASAIESVESALSQPIDIQELAIVVVAKGTNPNLLNPEFFVYSGIIPRDWQLARPLVSNEQVTQLVFHNGISVLVEPNKVTFSEAIGSKSPEEMAIAELAKKYVAALPEADYQAIGINPKRVFTFNAPSENTAPKAAHEYITGTLLAPGDWQGFGQEMQASLNLSYTLDDCRFQLSINPTDLRLPNDEQITGLLFSGNFHYDIAAVAPADRPQQIAQALSSWQTQLETYRSLLDQQFKLHI